MNRLTLAAAVAAFTVCAAPALAQAAAPQAAPAEAAAVKSPEEVAFEAKGEAFQAQAERMRLELEAVMGDDALDAATKKTRTDAVISAYEPAFSTFADDYAAFLRVMADKPENAAQKADILSAADAAPAQLRGVPAQLRLAVDQALAAQATAPAAN